MAYKRILTIQDISCVGQCSMTVAVPVLNACGLETCILPTALLSTHTGGFGKPAVVHFDHILEDIRRHWAENSITFDGILVGYLGSIPAIEAAKTILDTMLAPGGIAIVDPAMADHGKLYSGFDQAYAQAMTGLCRKADILLPNMTEAAMLSGLPCPAHPGEEEVTSLLTGLDHPCVVLTGVSRDPAMTGSACLENGALRWHSHPKADRSFHGTGDLFAAVFAGRLFQGDDLDTAAAFAGEFTYRCIENTVNNPAHWYGLRFEELLPQLSPKRNP